VPIVAVGALTVGLSRLAPLVGALRSHGALIAGRVVLVAVGFVALPGCLSALVDIAGRQP